MRWSASLFTASPGQKGKAFSGVSIAESDRAADAELAHAGLQRGAFHAKNIGRASGASDAPLGLFEGAEDVLAFGFFESGDWRN